MIVLNKNIEYYWPNCVCAFFKWIYKFDGTILENLTSWYKLTPSHHSTGIHHWWPVLVEMETHLLLVIWPCPDSSFCIASMFSIPGRFLFPSLGNWYCLHCLFQPCDNDIRWRWACSGLFLASLFWEASFYIVYVVNF